MAIAPAITAGVSAVGTVAGIAQQSRAASAQRAAIQAQNISARQQADLMQSRLESAERVAQDEYLRNRAILDKQTDMAKLNLQSAQIQTDMQTREQEIQVLQQEAQVESQVQQLLSAAAQQDMTAGLENMERFRQLAAVFTGNEESANAITRMAAMSELGGGTLDRLQREMELADIEALQATDEAVDTANRIAGFNIENLQGQADIASRTQNVMSDIYRSQIERQRELNAFTFERMPGILDLQSRRQSLALDAERASQAASLQLQQQANSMNLQNTLATNDARMAGVQGPNVLGGLLNIGTSILGAVQQSQPIVQPIDRGGGGIPIRVLPSLSQRSFTDTSHIDFHRR